MRRTRNLWRSKLRGPKQSTYFDYCSSSGSRLLPGAGTERSQEKPRDTKDVDIDVQTTTFAKEANLVEAAAATWSDQKNSNSWPSNLMAADCWRPMDSNSRGRRLPDLDFLPKNSGKLQARLIFCSKSSTADSYPPGRLAVLPPTFPICQSLE